MDFEGRDKELDRLLGRLGEIRRSGSGAMIAMRGRRRVGKSRLAQELAARAGCPTLFYTAVREPPESELDRFIEAAERSDIPRAEAIGSGLRPETWEAALELAVEGATADRPILLIIDELPYLTESYPAIEAIIQRLWDHVFQHAPVMVILIGSNEAMMEALTERGRPLFDRAREMVVNPLTPADVADLLGLDPLDAIDAHLIIGGFPVLIQEWGHGRRLVDYLGDALSDPTSFLVVSGERTLAAELPNDAQPRRVLAAIGAGARAHSAIAGKTGLHSTGLDRALGHLREAGIISRLLPYSTKPAPKTALWEVTDPYMRFWLRFVNGRIDEIERGRGAVVLEDFASAWPSFRGRAVEHLVRDTIERMLPDRERFGAARHVGGYWNRPGTVEVDLVGGDDHPTAKEIGFVGSIKWRESAPFERRDLLRLASQRGEVPGAGDSTRLIGVSSQGFEGAEGLDIRIGPDELVEAWRG